MKAQVVQTIDIAQAKLAISQAATLYMAKDTQGNYLLDTRRARPVCLMGPAGIGKTEIVRQVAQEQDLAFVSYSITHHTRQSAMGLPRLITQVVDGQEVSVTEYTMSEIIAAMHREMARTGKKNGILFLDEFNCASETMRPIMLQLLQNKTFGPHELPKGWMLVLAGNSGNYNASATNLDAVTADRLRMLWLEADYLSWRNYITQKNIHPMVLSYLDDHKHHFYQFERSGDGTALVTARGWEDLSVMLRMMEEAGFPIDVSFVAQYIQSAAVANEFTTYYRYYHKLMSSGLVGDILAGKNFAKREKEATALDFQHLWALTCVLVLRLEQHCSTDETAEAMDNVLHFYQEALSDKPQTEFLLNAITMSKVCSQWLSTHSSQVYTQLVGKLYGGTPLTTTTLRKRLKKTV